MINAGVGGNVDVLQLAAEARAGPHIGVLPLRQIENAGHVLWCGVGAGAVERNDERNRYAIGIELLRHHHHRVRAERMTDQNVGTAITGPVLLHDVGDDGVLDGMIINAGLDAMARDLRRQLIHAE